MKKILLPFLGIAMLVFSMTTEAAWPGGKNLPGTITNSIKTKYPDARIRTWTITNNNYVVKIAEQNDKSTVWYTRDGNWVQTEKHLALTKDLPEPVRHGFNKSKYASWHIDSIKELSTPDGQTKYVLHVDDGDKYTGGQVDAKKSDYLVWFSPDGSMIDHTVYHYNSPNK